MNALNGGGRPLDGIRVLDFSHAAAAPFASMFLGDLGAEVIKIEKPGHGDGSRSMGVPMPMLGAKDSDYYVSLNRNKKGVVIDLAQPEGAALARRLAAQCDVVVENFRPRVMGRLGLAFEDLRDLRRGLVYCSISAFGDSGPWCERPANDIIMQSVTGLMGVTGPAVEEYVKAVRKADLAEKGDADVIRKVMKDFADKGVKMAEADLSKKMHEFLAQAVQQIEGSGKT